MQPAVQQPTPPPPDEVTMTPAEPIVETTTMAGAPHVLRADPTRSNIDLHSIAGFAAPKLQSVVDLVPEGIRKKVSLALAKAVEATALVADPSLKIGAKPADRPPILQRLGAKLRDLAVAIRLFGDSGNLTDADPTTVERANQQKAEKKMRDEEAAAIAKKATQDAKNPQLDLGPAPAPPDTAPAGALAPLPNGPLQPMPPKKETEGAEKPGVSNDGSLFSPSERDADKGFKQANDARTDDQTAEGPKTAQGALAKKEHGGKEGEIARMTSKTCTTLLIPRARHTSLAVQ